MSENILIGCDYKNLNKNTPVFNLSSLQSFIWMSIPKYLNRCKLYEIYDLSHQAQKEVDFYGKIHQDFNHPWIQIPTEILDLKSGKHIYKFCFLDERMNQFHNIFVSYISQDDNPETPYVYMEGRGNKNHDANVWKDGQYSEEFFEKMRETIKQNYGYDPFQYNNYTQLDYCSRCTTYDCQNCPYKT